MSTANLRARHWRRLAPRITYAFVFRPVALLQSILTSEVRATYLRTQTRSIRTATRAHAVHEEFHKYLLAVEWFGNFLVRIRDNAHARTHARDARDALARAARAISNGCRFENGANDRLCDHHFGTMIIRSVAAKCAIRHSQARVRCRRMSTQIWDVE